MSWIESRKARDATRRWRLRDVIGGQKKTIIKDLGIWKAAANTAKENFEKAHSMGFTFTPPIKVADIDAFLKAKSEGRDAPDQLVRLLIEQMCDLFLKHHGPSVKGGVSSHYKSAYHDLELRMNRLKKAWVGKYADEIHKFMVRDFLAQFNTVGYRMRWISTIGSMFNSFVEWNDMDEGEILGFKVRLPKINPVRQWRRKMKPAEKKELPDRRVLSEAEWAKFSPHLTPRPYAICDMALRRLLRTSDIRKICDTKIMDGYIHGLQEKTGEEYTVPVLDDQPTEYDFTNYRREFNNAKVAADMNWPKGHPLYFSTRTLRRTGAMWAYRKTKDLVGISNMLGHKSLATTKRYLNIDDTDRIKIASAIDRIADRSLLKSGGAGGERAKNMAFAKE